MENKRTLLDIRDDLEALDALLCEVGGDVSDPRVEAAVAIWLTELDQDLRGKVDGYAGLIASLEARSEFHKSEAARFAQWAKTEAGNAGFLRTRLKLVLEQRGISKLETPHYRLGIQRNGGAAPLLVDPGAMVPDQFMRIVPEQKAPDNEKLRAALDAGEQIPGIRLGERGTRLSIR